MFWERSLWKRGELRHKGISYCNSRRGDEVDDDSVRRESLAYKTECIRFKVLNHFPPSGRGPTDVDMNEPRYQFSVSFIFCWFIYVLTSIWILFIVLLMFLPHVEHPSETPVKHLNCKIPFTNAQKIVEILLSHQLPFQALSLLQLVHVDCVQTPLSCCAKLCTKLCHVIHFFFKNMKVVQQLQIMIKRHQRNILRLSCMWHVS